ncbi:hypothetical protein K0M31_009303 [Melipona bicolor]|uniref:Uncharacterized protein n=1 Tax=Melipona bicolor TaxID=60889 RepID=A0AA40KJM4_9HYME|nr:hypothetical protein K0M31_009303 [Melipona bicolor]
MDIPDMIGFNTSATMGDGILRNTGDSCNAEVVQWNERLATDTSEKLDNVNDTSIVDNVFFTTKPTTKWFTLLEQKYYSTKSC